MQNLLGFMENGCIMMDSKKSNAQEVACLNSTQPNSKRHHIAFMFNFGVLNLDVDCKEAEQKLLELLFKLDHDQLTSILLSHLFWRFAFTFIIIIILYYLYSAKYICI